LELHERIIILGELIKLIGLIITRSFADLTSLRDLSTYAVKHTHKRTFV